jgi:hypothetical protein
LHSASWHCCAILPCGVLIVECRYRGSVATAHQQRAQCTPPYVRHGGDDPCRSFVVSCTGSGRTQLVFIIVTSVVVGGDFQFCCWHFNLGEANNNYWELLSCIFPSCQGRRARSPNCKLRMGYSNHYVTGYILDFLSDLVFSIVCIYKLLARQDLSRT